MENGWSFGEAGFMVMGQISQDESPGSRKLPRNKRATKACYFSSLARADFYCPLFFSPKRDHAAYKPQQRWRDRYPDYVQVGISNLKRIKLTCSHQSME